MTVWAQSLRASSAWAEVMMDHEETVAYARGSDHHSQPVPQDGLQQRAMPMILTESVHMVPQLGVAPQEPDQLGGR